MSHLRETFLLKFDLTVEARTSLWASIDRWVFPTKIVTSMRCPCLLNSSISGKAPLGMSHWLNTTQSVPSLNSISEKYKIIVKLQWLNLKTTKDFYRTQTTSESWGDPELRQIAYKMILHCWLPISVERNLDISKWLI